ncbi:regulator of Vps4 activity in the MVB pathway-domain-containing protein [Dipodascopsis uninucleata]
MPPANPLTTRLKIHLKLSISRLRYVQQKDAAVAKQQRRDIAHLLEVSKDQSARIRVENIIRTEINIELLEILELYCELLLARIGLIEQRRDCDPGLEEAVRSVIYASGRTDIKELQQVRDMLILKFGKEFARETLDEPEKTIPERVLKKLIIEPPKEELVTLYLEEIARTYRIPWQGLPEEERKKFLHQNDDFYDDDDGGSGGGIGETDSGLQLPSVGQAEPGNQASPISVAPIAATSENPKPKVVFQGQSISKPAAASSKKSDIPDLDELSKRFAALKR